MMGGRPGAAAMSDAAMSRARNPGSFEIMASSLNPDPVQLDFSVASSDFLHGNTHLIHDRDQEVCIRWLVGKLDMATTLQLAGTSTHEQLRQVIRSMTVAV